MFNTFSLISAIGAVAAAVDTAQLQWAKGTPGPGQHGSGFAFNGHYGNHNNHEHGHNHKNPWYHTVVHHKSADDYHSDPWERRGHNGGDATRQDWYSPYQQFSPPQIAYIPTVSHATFARCFFDDTNNEGNGTVPNLSGSEIKIGQLKGKAPVVKMELIQTNDAGSLDLASQFIELKIHQYGTIGIEDSTATPPMTACMFIGEEYNPLNEVDKYGRDNPFQDPLRGKLERVQFDADTSAMGEQFITTSPMNLLQNLEGKESILGRSIAIYALEGMALVENEILSEIPLACCIIARDQVPSGFGPKPIPYPLTTHSHTYASYGKNVAYPSNVNTPTHSAYKGGHSYGHGYHPSPDADDYHHTITSLSGRSRVNGR